MVEETLWVRPDDVREEAGAIGRAAESLAGDFAKARAGLKPAAHQGVGFGAVAAARTLSSLWEVYLSGWGSTLDGAADRLVKVADAYQRRDAEAAEALGVALPRDEPSRRRPGHSEF
ncbi:MAG: hypothetical protein ACRDT6_21085 [Micromonosporaceae bacterium]